MTEYEMHIFITIYEWLYEVVQRTHKGCMVDQASLMDGAIKLYKDTLERGVCNGTD